MPPSIPPILALDSWSTFFTASLPGATIMSCSISTSPATSGSILTANRFFCPSILTVTMPPPAEASTLIRAISCASFSCICCAWRIICCMLPGSFTLRLLQVSNFANFSRGKDFAEALHFGMGQRAAGGLILGDGRRCGPWCGFGRGRPIADLETDAQRPAEAFAYGLFEAAVAKVERVGFGGQHLQVSAGHGDARVLHRVGQMRQAFFVNLPLQALARVARGHRRGRRLGG